MNNARGRVVILGLRDSGYYGQSGPGTHWQLLQTPRRVDDIAGSIAGAFAVTREQAVADLQALLADLEARGPSRSMVRPPITRRIRRVHRAARKVVAAARALAWLIVARIALRFRSYSASRRALGRLSRRRTAGLMLTASECEQAVRRASRIPRRASCLDRAVAAACLLRREGRDATLTIGVCFDAERRLVAHAWRESGGLHVTGGPESCNHRVLLRDAI